MISPDGVSPNADKVAALTKMPMPSNVNQTRALLGGIGYYRKFLPDLAKRLRPTSALLKQGTKFIFTPAMEATVRQILHDLATPPVLVFPDWDAVADNSHPCTATPAAMASAPPSSRNNPTAPSAPSSSSVAPPWTPNVLGHPLTWKPVVSFGPSNGYEVTSDPPSSASVRITRRTRA